MCPKQRRITAEALLPFLLPLGILTWEDADVVPPWETGLLTGMEQKGPSGARRVCWGFSCRSRRQVWANAAPLTEVEDWLHWPKCSEQRVVGPGFRSRCFPRRPHPAGGIRQEPGWEQEVTLVLQMNEIIIVNHLTQGWAYSMCSTSGPIHHC